MKRILYLIISLCALMSSGAVTSAQTATPPDSVATQPLRVSVITCSPGPEIYELVGHTAIRIQGADMDSVWNYGLFDFAQPNFVYRFVKGETDYMVAGYPFEWFLPEYISRGSRVTEQTLDLTPEEGARLRKLLQTESLPANRVYRYNYVLDNCATRVRDRIDDALGTPADYPDTIRYGTFRRAMRAHHRDYPWYQLGIDLALGNGIDRPVTAREEMFAPTVFSEELAGARRPDGRPLVRETRILVPGTGHATLPPTPWWQTPTAASILVLLLLIGVCVHDWRRGRLTRWVYCLWFSLLGLAGCLIAFLVFVSSHEATSPNLLLLWLNPLQLVGAVCVWIRRARMAAVIVGLYDFIVVGGLLIAWPLVTQSTSPAVLILMGATAIVGATYQRLAYNKRRSHTLK